ncbi:MAG: hypothetical protein IT580_03470, partial [Verrucomicrobiales bacterium]|nr:hypothetical protein [Verrucomicrobiales bacterium]
MHWTPFPTRRCVSPQGLVPRILRGALLLLSLAVPAVQGAKVGEVPETLRTRLGLSAFYQKHVALEG